MTTGNKIKSILLFNLDDVIASKVKELLFFIIRYSISNTKDIENLLIYYILKEILRTYKNNSGMIVFYLSTKCYEWLASDSAVVRDMDFKKLLKIFTKSIHFPIIISNVSFLEFKALLSSNSPEYDEVVNNYNFISTYMSDIIDLIKSLKFTSLEDSLVNDLMAQIRLITTFNS